MNDSDDSVVRVAIVDDEAPARMILREFLAQHEDLQIVAECCNGFEAVKAVSELRPDLMLLDVQMPKLSGFEVLELIGTQVTVIFTTAFDSYAIRAFDVHAVDYLLKPFSAERFAAALSRARKRLRSREPLPVSELVAASRASSAPLDRIVIRDRANVHVVAIDKIDYIEAQDDYVSVKTAGRSYLKEQTLADLDKLLEAKGFVRIHRRYLLNVTRLAKIELAEKDSRLAILADGTQLPISRSGYLRLRELL